MERQRENALSAGLLLLRVGIGCLMLVHGVAKIQGFGQMSTGFPDPLGLGSQLSLIMAIAAEVGCSILLIIGLGSRLAAIPLAFTMFVALFLVHQADPWKAKELASVYLLVYVSLVLTGPGRFSLDQLWCSKPIQSAQRPVA
jgi:putative oxidoreductase